jgi:hypothetical protein
MRLLFLAFLLFFVPPNIYSQGVATSQDSTVVTRPASPEGDEDITILYRKEASGGITVHSNGWGLTFKSGKHVTGFRKRILDFEFLTMKHPKEYSSPSLYDGSKSFIFGKLNYVFFLRGGWGYQNILFAKGERSGVEIRYNYYGGLDLGITKPVYLDFIEDDPNNPDFKILNTKRYNPDDPNQGYENIYGGASFFKGFGEMSIHPGVYGKFAISFEYAAWQQKIAALETGVMVDYFPDAIPMMAFNKYPNLFFNFYISILWGGKW